MAQRSYLWLLIGLAVTGLTLDLFSKYAVFRSLYKDGYTWGKFDLIPGVFQFYVDYNPDA